jgi:hypothetical protein
MFNLCCTILLSCYAQYLYFYLETVVLTSLYLFCIVFVSFVCVSFFLTSFMSDCFHIRICGPVKWYGMCVCMYVCIGLIKMDVKLSASTAGVWELVELMCFVSLTQVWTSGDEWYPLLRVDIQWPRTGLSDPRRAQLHCSVHHHGCYLGYIGWPL